MAGQAETERGAGAARFLRCRPDKAKRSLPENAGRRGQPRRHCAA